ncbi:site-specific recombinase, phage integrase family [Plakobranchus ocellatus]|uniref:Site-specific recombinase, phage integrase family n=1 Tax=Plakobranchus ocellatus TaxID=259542 RepID=A0AAV4ANH7_9GAST|nr:site-specific recombinase, phage integrase family [Plakobranchus ocellatus]
MDAVDWTMFVYNTYLPATVAAAAEKIKTGGMQNIRQRFREDGFSLEATKLLMDSWCPGTKQQYEHYIKKWTAYAERVGVDCMPVAQAVNFLAELYTSGASFSALCSATSAFSCFIFFMKLIKHLEIYM